MTLVIAGYNFDESKKLFGGDLTPIDGVFFVTDSAITTPAENKGRKTLLNGFKKVYSIPIKVQKPHFVGDLFHSYSGHCYTGECVIAIAGNTLTAQHVINSITNHLSNLKLSYKRDPVSDEAQYIILMECEDTSNPLIVDGVGASYGEDMFVVSECKEFLNAEMISEIVKHSIKASLSSAKQYKLDPADFRSLYTEYLLAVYDPNIRDRNNDNFLYKYTLKTALDEDGMMGVDVDKHFIPHDEIGMIGMIGMVDDFYSDANDKVHSYSRYESSSEVYFEFLKESIANKNRDGNNEIAFPAAMFTYQSGRLKKISHYEAD